MTGKTAHSARIWIWPTAIALSLLILPIVCWRYAPFSGLLVAGVHREADPGNWIRGFDSIFQQVAPGGDVAIQFENFDAEDENHSGFAGEVVGRGTYTLLPRRLNFAEEGSIIMLGRTVIDSKFHPSPQWLESHDVRSLLVYSNQNGQLQMRLAKYPAKPGAPVDDPKPVAVGGFAAVLAIAGYVITFLLLGYALTSLALLGTGRHSMTELVGLVLTLGGGGTGLALLGISLAGVRPGRGAIAVLFMASVVTILFLRRRQQLPCLKSREPLDRNKLFTTAELVAAMLLLTAAVCAVIVSMGTPIVNWDSFMMWALKAKVLEHEPLTPRPAFFNDVRLGFVHLDYPLLFPMLLAGAFGAIGQPNEQLGKIVLPMLFAGQMLLCYSGVRMWLNRLPAMAVTALFICMPVSMLNSGLCTADLPLTTFWMGAVLYMTRWTLHGQRADLILTGLFTSFAANTKNEGLMLALIICLAALGVALGRRDRRSWIDLTFFAAIMAVGAGTWVAWRAGLPHIDENYPARLRWSIVSTNLDRLWIALTTLIQTVMSINLWGIFWPMLIALAIAGWRAFARTEVRWLWAILLLHLSAYMVAWVISPFEIHTLLRDSQSRLLLHISPVAALLLAAHWAGAASDRYRDNPVGDL